MNRKEFLKIVKRYRDHTATEEERELIETYYELLGLQEGPDEKVAAEELEDQLLKALWEKIYEREQSSAHKKRLFLRNRNIAAAFMVLMATGLTYFLLSRDSGVSNEGVYKEQRTAEAVVIEPAGQKAVLTLGNGKKVLLGKDAERTISGIARQHNGKLVYLGNKKEKKQLTEYNTLSTPHGAKFKLVLSDGTKVWLNAGSTLRYPVDFSGKERKITLTGEAYFEVAQDVNHPFRVAVQDVEVRVLGTHFNIKAYNDMGESRTTLAEGKVEIIKGAKTRLLDPGEQAVIEKGSNNIEVNKVDLLEMLAWKNGLFYFNQTNIKEIMDELSRWYNVKVVYDRKRLKALNFSGVMSRYKNIDDVLKRISLTGTVHFTVEGRTVIVRK